MAFQRNTTSITRADLQTKLSANAADVNTWYVISNAVGSTKVIQVQAASVSALRGTAENFTDSTFGVYDISADTFVAQGGGSGVASVTGNIVDNTVPTSPVVTSPYTKDADGNVFYDGVTATLGTGCTNNTFQQAAGINTLGNNCSENIFQQGASGNTLGTDSTRNLFDIATTTNQLGANSNVNTFEQGVNAFIFSSFLQNTTIRQGTNGADYTASPDYDFLYGNAYPSEIFYNGTDNYHSYYDTANKRIVLTNLTTLAVTYIGGDGYVTISLASWTALVAASGLVPGTFYRVTAAYTFDFYGAKDIIVVADSVNTVQATAYAVFGDVLVPYTTDSALNQGLFLDCIVVMALDPDAVYEYITGSPNFRFGLGVSIFMTATDGYIYQGQIQGDDEASILLTNVKSTSGPNLGQFGTYVPETAPAAADDTFIPNPVIRTQRLVLSTGDIQAGTAIALSQFPAIAGYYWNVTNAIVALTAGATPYTTTLFVQANGATNDQWRYALTSATSEKVLITDRRTNGDCFPDNAGMEIQFSGSDFSGDGQAIVWVTAELLTT